MSASPSAHHGDSRRVVVVTGASSGIGRATAILLSRQGNHVVLASRSPEALEAAQDDCMPGSSAVVPTDVRDSVQVQSLMAQTVATYGRVDAVVHSAAVLAYGRFEDIPEEVFDQAIATTLTGTANVARATLRLFQEQHGGSLVVVGSLLGKISTPYMSSYVTAKWAIHGLVRTLQIEARQTPGIHISLVSPGGIDTPVYTQAGTYLGRHGRPPPPIAAPEQVAAVISRRLDRPARDSNVGPANALTVAGFRALPAVFDRLVTPLMHTAGLSRDAVDPTVGNVLAPQPDGEAVHGDWPALRDGNIGALRVRTARSPQSPGATGGQRHRLACRREPASSRLGRNVHRDSQGRIEVDRVVDASASDVWAVLADGWMYSSWVVGASRVRSVDLSWPAVGSRIHHSFGIWPAVLDDVTRCLELDPERRLVLQAKGWPLGEAQVEITIDELADRRSRVVIVEDVTAGPGLATPRLARQIPLAGRNVETLHRLALIAQGQRRRS